jgi:hypothetical protein
MSKDFQNGFALGWACGGVVDEKILDHTVIFMVDGEPYEVVSVKDGNSVNAPINPTSENGGFDSWEIDGTKVTFPYTPTNNITMNAVFYDGVDLLYTKFNIDRTAYPNVFLHVEPDGRIFSLYFLSPEAGYTWKQGYSGVVEIYGDKYFVNGTGLSLDPSNFNAIYDFIMGSNRTATLCPDTKTANVYMGGNAYFYTTGEKLEREDDPEGGGIWVQI